MTQTLQFLTETPKQTAKLRPLPRDILSDILRIIRFSGAITFRPELSAPWAIQSLPHADFAAALQVHTKHFLPFHIMVAGDCWIQAIDGPWTRLSEGDIIIFPHGDVHWPLASYRILTIASLKLPFKSVTSQKLLSIELLNGMWVCRLEFGAIERDRDVLLNFSDNL